MFDTVQHLHTMLAPSHVMGLISIKDDSTGGVLDMSNSASGGDVPVIVSPQFHPKSNTRFRNNVNVAGADPGG